MKTLKTEIKNIGKSKSNIKRQKEMERKTGGGEED